MKHTKYIVLSVILLVSSAVAQTSTTNWVAANLLKHTTFTLEEEFRQSGDRARSFYEHTDFQVKYAVNGWLDAFGSYRLIYQDKGHGYHTASMFVPGFMLKAPTTLLPAKYGALSLRSRVELTLQDSQNKASYQDTEFLKYSLPWKWSRWQIQPFVGEELFFDCAKDLDFNRNRFYAGVDFVLSSRVKGSLFWYDQQDKGKRAWTSDNIIVAQVKFVF
jgi:hypothetical protein